MNNNDERDYAEEQANRDEMQMPECGGHESIDGPEETVYCDGSCVPDPMLRSIEWPDALDGRTVDATDGIVRS